MLETPPSIDRPVWLCKTNTDPFNVDQAERWVPYSPDISEIIEKAYRRGSDEIFIKDVYRIDFAHQLQVHIDDSSRQRPIRRQNGINDSISESEHEQERWHRERYAFPLDPAALQSTMIDTQYQGSPLIIEWFESFTGGKLKFTFNRIFDLLIEGIRKEGQEQGDPHTTQIIDFLYRIKYSTAKLKDTKRIEKLQEGCAKLYTKDCFLFALANRTLRDHNRNKMATLGPFCYLVYNYIGSQFTDHMSIRHRLRQLIRPTESHSIIVYRGDHAAREKIEEYRQAAGKKDKYFKWLPFVSTSLDIDVAERFGRNILYIIELHRYTSNDQFVSLEKNSYHNDEVEILLRPGIRFRVDKVQFDEETGRERVYIQIVSSYVSNLR
jgi:hypothetical protein